MSEIKITYKFNPKTGQTIEFTIDDQLRTAPEEYHNDVTELLAGKLARSLEYSDAVSGEPMGDRSVYFGEDLSASDEASPNSDHIQPSGDAIVEQPPKRNRRQRQTRAGEETVPNDGEILGNS